MKFHAHDAVIELLVGENLYTSTDAAIRELLQNAEDACELQSIVEPDYKPSIEISYSTSENVLEVRDNGYGMNDEALEKSFASIAAPKTDVSHIRELLSQGGRPQIAQFGIGILSCFGVANSIRVECKTAADEPIGFDITDYRKEFEFFTSKKSDRGTKIKLNIKADSGVELDSLPQIVKRYARHVPHVSIHNVDTDTHDELLETWRQEVEGLDNNINDEAVNIGRLTLGGGWQNINESLLMSITLCNGGFLVDDNDAELLPKSAVGIVGELDLIPGALTILLNREGFKKDEHWNNLSSRLTAIVKVLHQESLREWDAQLPALLDDDPRAQAVVRALLILLHGHPRNLLDLEDIQRAEALLNRMLQLLRLPSESSISLLKIIEMAKENGILYTTREGEKAQSFSESISDEGSQLQLTESTQTLGLRVIALSANGFPIVRCRQHNYTLSYGGQQENFSINDQDVLREFSQRVGVELRRVEEAPDEHINIFEMEGTRLVNSLFALGGDFKVTFVETSAQRVIRDYTGRYLNAAHPEVAEILAAMPDALGNPIKRKLLNAYMALTYYGLSEARSLIKELLLDPELEEKSQLKTGQLLADHLRHKLNEILSRAE